MSGESVVPPVDIKPFPQTHEKLDNKHEFQADADMHRSCKTETVLFFPAVSLQKPPI